MVRPKKIIDGYAVCMRCNGEISYRSTEKGLEFDESVYEFQLDGTKRIIHKRPCCSRKLCVIS